MAPTSRIAGSLFLSFLAATVRAADTYCTFYSDSSCKTKFGSVSYDISNPGCFSNSGPYMKCDYNLIQMAVFSDGACGSEVTQWTYNEIHDNGDGCYDLAAGPGLGGSYTLSSATSYQAGKASVTVWPSEDCEGGPGGSLYAAGNGGDYESGCIAFIGGAQKSYSAAFDVTGASVNCEVSGYSTADCSDSGVTLLSNELNCLNQDLMAMKVSCTKAGFKFRA